MTVPRVKMVCPKCGDDTQVVCEALAEWDIEAQEWVLRTLYETFACTACEANDIEPNQEPIEDA